MASFRETIGARIRSTVLLRMSWSTAVLHTGPISLAAVCTHTRSPGPLRGESEGVGNKTSAPYSHSKVHEAKTQQRILGFNGAQGNTRPVHEKPGTEVLLPQCYKSKARASDAAGINARMPSARVILERAPVSAKPQFPAAGGWHHE